MKSLCQRRTGVAAAAVDLADDDVSRLDRGRSRDGQADRRRARPGLRVADRRRQGLRARRRRERHRRREAEDVVGSSDVPVRRVVEELLRCRAADRRQVAVTPSPVLVGFVPGVTATVRRVDPPTVTVEGFAAPTPVGFVLPPQTLALEAEFRGLGVPAAKSPELLSVSVQPPADRSTDVELLGAGVGAAPSKQLAVVPKPTKSATPMVGQEPVSAVALETSATSPAVPDIAIVPVASGVGREWPSAPCASWTR